MLHKGWKVETTQMSISCWMDRQFVVEATTICGLAIQWILFGHKKERSSDTCYNMDEPWKHAQWMKTDIKGHILGTSLVVQQLRLYAPNVGGQCSVATQYLHMP